jgi:UDP-glucose 4-epimerase
MRVLVTGGAGFIGSHVVEALLARGHDLAVLDDLSSGRREHVPVGVRLYVADVRDRAAVHAAFAEFRPEAVSHHAAQINVGRSLREPALDAAVNVVGGLNVLDSAIEVGTSRFVFASSGGAIYGELPEPEVGRVGGPERPQNPYGIHKRCFEQLLDLAARQHGFAAVSLRYANVYGPRQAVHGEGGVVAVFCDRARRGEPLEIYGAEREGDDGGTRDYVFVGDAARANVAAVEGGVVAPVLDVASGVGTSTRGLAHAVLAVIGVSGADSKPIDRPPRAGDVRRSVLDGRAFWERVGPVTSLRAGLEATWSRGADRVTGRGGMG